MAITLLGSLAGAVAGLLGVASPLVGVVSPVVDMFLSLFLQCHHHCSLMLMATS